VQVRQLNLERNAKGKECKAVLKHIQHRVHKLGKANSAVRIRGHEISEEKLLRWLKANPPEDRFLSIKPPSSKLFYRALDGTLSRLALPDYISIYTNSVSDLVQHKSPGSTHQEALNRFVNTSATANDLSRRLLHYAQGPKHIIKSQDVRALFNDLQMVLMDDFNLGERNSDSWITSIKEDIAQRRNNSWNAGMREDIIRLRNFMNITHKLLVDVELKGLRLCVTQNVKD
jgi:hypothetical protein